MCARWRSEFPRVRVSLCRSAILHFCPDSEPLRRLPKNLLIFGGIALWAVGLVSCVMTNRTILMPPFIEGASIVGAESCVKCHSNITRGFHDATHAHLMIERAMTENRRTCRASRATAPAACTSRRARATTIINPKIAPDTCIQCHINTRSEFSLPHTHPVLEWKNCVLELSRSAQGRRESGDGRNEDAWRPR